MKISPNNSEAYNNAKARVQKLKGFYWHLFFYIAINIFLIIISFNNRSFTFDNFFKFKTFGTAIFWGIGIFFHALDVFGNNIFFGKKWEERKIEEFLKKKNSF